MITKKKKSTNQRRVRRRCRSESLMIMDVEKEAFVEIAGEKANEEDLDEDVEMEVAFEE
jgi:hypothetical protein